MCRRDDYPPHDPPNAETDIHGDAWVARLRAAHAMKEATNDPEAARSTVPPDYLASSEVRGSDPLPPPLVVELAREHARLVDQGKPDAPRLGADGEAAMSDRIMVRYCDTYDPATRFCTHANPTRHRTLAQQEATMPLREIGFQPVTTKTDVFVYPDTTLGVSLPVGLSPHVKIGVPGEGIDLFFMGGSDLDAIAALNRFVNYVTEYRDALLLTRSPSTAR